MKTHFKKILITGISILILACSPALLKAEPDPPCVGPDPQTGECPIDSGLLILIAIGAGYGIKKVIDSRKEHAME